MGLAALAVSGGIDLLTFLLGNKPSSAPSPTAPGPTGSSAPTPAQIAGTFTPRTPPVNAPGSTSTGNTLLGGTDGTAVPRGSLIAGTDAPSTPTPPDPLLQASQDQILANQEAQRVRNRAQAGSSDGSLLTQTPGAATPTATGAPRTLLGY